MRTFEKGDTVQVMNNDGTPNIGFHKVVYAGPFIARIEDGRRYRQSDGWWIGQNGIWPFPWLKKTEMPRDFSKLIPKQDKDRLRLKLQNRIKKKRSRR